MRLHLITLWLWLLCITFTSYSPSDILANVYLSAQISLFADFFTKARLLYLQIKPVHYVARRSEDAHNDLWSVATSFLPSFLFFCRNNSNSKNVLISSEFYPRQKISSTGNGINQFEEWMVNSLYRVATLNFHA